ncbi:MAG: phage tail protein [Lactobacillus sp.]|jgi:phi13 family phage major tail protein|nr:phage tail protein [Lactobacillus sp.]
MGKAKFGASAFEYGVVKEDLVPNATVKVPGLTTAEMELKNELKTLMADDGPYITVSGGISEATLSLELFDLPPKVKQDFFGIDVVKGVEVYTRDLTPNDVAVLFKTKMEDGKAVWVAMLKGKFSLPGLSTKTNDGTPDPNPDKTEGSFAPRGDADRGTMVLIGREDQPDFDLETFRKWVFPKTAEEAIIKADEPAKAGAGVVDESKAG